MKRSIKEWRIYNEHKVTTGMKIGSDNRSVPIKVVENTKSNRSGFVARVFYRPSENSWFASTVDMTRGLIVYVDKKPLLSQKIHITEVYERYAIGTVVDPK